MLRSRIGVFVSLLVLGVLTACSQLDSATSNRDIQALIDPAIQGQERKIIAHKMALLPPKYRQNVIYFAADGTIYANRPELKTEFSTYKLESNGLYRNAKGQTLYLPEDPTPSELSAQAACTSTTGPYYRVYSNPGSGPYSFYPTRYAYTHSQINLLGGAYITVTNPSNETVYTYLGGWANGGNGTAVDAGFQYDPNTNEENWALFIKTPGAMQISDDYAYRFASGQQANLEFYVPSDDNVVVYASGSYAHPVLAGSSSGERTLMADAPGWRADGLDNVMKRVTTIAQENQNLSSGSIINGLKWLGYEIGMPPPSLNVHGWSGSDTASPDGICKYPNETVVQVTPQGSNSEKITIDLSQ